MGVFVADFPNMFMVTGPQAPFANLPTSIEQNVICITKCIEKMEREGYDIAKPKREAEQAWTAHTADIHRPDADGRGRQGHSWMMGANREDKPPRVLIYFGGANVYYDKLARSAEAGFPELEFASCAGRPRHNPPAPCDLCEGWPRRLIPGREVRPLAFRNHRDDETNRRPGLVSAVPCGLPRRGGSFRH